VKRRFAAVAVVVLGLALGGCTSNATAVPSAGAFVFVSPGGKSEFSYPVGERGTVADFTGTSVTDAQQTIKLSDYTGKVMVLNVWGSWCGPCRGEAKDLNVAAELATGKPVQYLGINIQDDRQAAADFIASTRTTYPSIFDPTTRTLLSMNGLPTSSIPTTIVLDQEHKVAHIYLRVITAQELTEAVDALLAEGENTADVTSSAPDMTADPEPADNSAAEPTS